MLFIILAQFQLYVSGVFINIQKYCNNKPYYIFDTLPEIFGKKQSENYFLIILS